MVFLGGISKVLFSALALSVTFAMTGSYFAAMAAIPAFAAKFMAGPPPKASELVLPLRLAHAGVSRLTHFYGRALDACLRHKLYLFATVAALLVAGAVAVPRVGAELFPRADAGNFIMKTRLASGTRIEETEKFARELNDELRRWIPARDLSMIVSNVGLVYGAPAAFSPNAGTQDSFFAIELTEDRVRSTQEYAATIREQMRRAHPDVEISFELGGLLSSALNGGLASPIDVQIEGKDLKTSRRLADQLVELIRAIPGAVDARAQQRLDAPQLYLDVDRDKADALGLSIDSAMKSVVSSVSGSSSFSPAIWVDPRTGLDFQFGVQLPEEGRDVACRT